MIFKMYQLKVIMKNCDVLETDEYYHIFNRAVGSDRLFVTESDYAEFIYKWKKYISPIAEVYSFCLMPNHFHFLAKMRSSSVVEKHLNCKKETLNKLISRRFASLFSSYAMAFNHRYTRKGKLFMLPFKRKKVNSDKYFTQMVYYIHRNPLHHGMRSDPGQWEYSSYSDLISDNPTWIHRNDVLHWFGGKKGFIEYHKYMNLMSE